MHWSRSILQACQCPDNFCQLIAESYCLHFLQQYVIVNPDLTYKSGRKKTGMSKLSGSITCHAKLITSWLLAHHRWATQTTAIPLCSLREPRCLSMQQIGADIRANSCKARSDELGRSMIGASCGSMWEFETAMAASCEFRSRCQGPKFDSYDMRTRRIIIA